MKKGIFFVSSLVLFGCTKYEGVPIDPKQVRIPFSVDYFKYRAIGQCGDGSLMFKYLQGTGIIFEFDAQVSSSVRTAQIDLFLLDQQSYEAHYSEYVDNIKVASQNLKGQFYEANQTIILEKLGSMTYFELNNKLGLNLKFNTDILTPGLVDKEVVMRSTLNPEGLLTRAQYCGQ